MVVKGSMSQMISEEMRRRTVTLSDGRYLIFYEFGGTPSQKDREPQDTENTGSKSVVEEESV